MTSAAADLVDLAMRSLSSAVQVQRGPDREWHRTNLLDHEQRYRADLRLIAGLKPSGTILDIGSAPCHMTALLQLTGQPVIGVDLAPQRVANLVEHFKLDVRQCDIERAQLPFADGQFCGALLCETFEHLRVDPALVISEICRVLSIGGFLLITTPNVYSLPSLARYALGRSIADPLLEFGKLRNLGHMGHVREYSAREVVRFVCACGFAVESVDYRYYVNRRSRKSRILGVAYKLVPRRFRRDIVVLARKINDGPGLVPLA